MYCKLRLFLYNQRMNDCREGGRRMDIQICEDAANREQWLEQLKNCDW